MHNSFNIVFIDSVSQSAISENYWYHWLIFGIRGTKYFIVHEVYIFTTLQGRNWRKKREIQFCSICIPCTSFMGANCIISLDATLPVELSSFSPLLGSRNCAAQILTLQHSGWARLRLAQKEERNSKTKKKHQSILSLSLFFIYKVSGCWLYEANNSLKFYH